MMNLPAIGAAVKTNNKWRAFFKTKVVIKGRVADHYDCETALVRLKNGQEMKIHKDWLEPDGAKVK